MISPAALRWHQGQRPYRALRGLDTAWRRRAIGRAGSEGMLPLPHQGMAETRLLLSCILKHLGHADLGWVVVFPNSAVVESGPILLLTDARAATFFVASIGKGRRG